MLRETMASKLEWLLLLIPFVCSSTVKDDLNLKDVVAEIRVLENLVLSQQTQIEALNREVEEHKERIAILEKQAEPQPEATHRQPISFPENDVISVNTSSFGEVILPSKRNRERQAESETPVAFFALLSDHVTHAGTSQNIAFDIEVTNIGNAYNPHAGLFVAPVSGIYVFSTTLLSYPHHSAHFNFMKNGVVVSSLHPHSADDSPGHDTAGMMVVLRLQKGDDVSVANRDADESLSGHRYSSFSGFLLQQMYDAAPEVVGK